MINLEHATALHGVDVYDRDGDKIGSVGQVWDDGLGRPAWASVRTGLFGLKESLVPLQDADLRDDRLVVPFEKATVKDAPNIDASDDEPLADEDVDRLYGYYGIDWQESYRSYRSGAATADANYAGPDQSYAGRETTTETTTGTTGGATATTGTGERSGTTDDAMTRAEERLNVDTEVEQTGRARLRKYVVTDREQVTVPVEREEVRLEREPITDANRDAALRGPDITESEYEVTLHAERPTVDTETVPVERVRLGKETVREEQTVGGEVRKERIEADLPDENGRRDLD
jgi:uncharacterized protein (TIGR02271 family)